MRMALQKKLALFIAFFVVVSLAGLAYLKYTQVHTVQSFYRTMEREFDEKADKSATSLSSFVTDYSYWDDLVAFLKKGNKQWASENIGRCLREYKANAVWVCSTDFSPAYACNNLSLKELNDVPVSSSRGRELFAKSRFCRFYVQTPKGVLEVRGATIHPTNDPERKTVPQGYLLAARLCNDSYAGELAALTGTAVKLLPAGGKKAPGSRYDPSAIQTVLSKALCGADGKPLMTAEIRTASRVVEDLETSLNHQIYSIAVLAAVLLAFLYIVLAVWVSKPLNQIYRSLDSEDLDAVSRLQFDNSEFGYIAQLIVKVIEQKSLLLKENAACRYREEADKKEIQELIRKNQQTVAALASLKELSRLTEADKGLAAAYDELKKQYEEQTSRLQVVNELLQREILHAHEHYKAELVAAYERDQVKEELKVLSSEIDKRDIVKLESAVPLLTAVPSAVGVFAGGGEEDPDIIIEKKPRGKRKCLGHNLPKINYNEARC